jgi:hypothetical protein
MKKYKSIILVLMVIVIFASFQGCDYETTESVDKQQTKKQESNQKDMYQKIQEPDIKNWTEKNLVSWLYELRDDSTLKCYYYTKNKMTGKYVYEGTCIGYGIPYSMQYSNPEKVVDLEDEINEHWASYWELALKPQAEPNGLFPPTSSSATWIIKTDPDNPEKLVAEYQEEPINITKIKKPRKSCEEWSLPSDY